MLTGEGEEEGEGTHNEWNGRRMWGEGGRRAKTVSDKG